MPNLRVLLAPDSFKGSLSAPEVARALAEGIANTNAQAECIRHPLADGGEGTLDVLVAAGFGVQGLGDSWLLGRPECRVPKLRAPLVPWLFLRSHRRRTCSWWLPRLMTSSD